MTAFHPLRTSTIGGKLALMKPANANLILLAIYAAGVGGLYFPDPWPWLVMVGVVVAVSLMMRLERPDSGESILNRNGLWLPFYIP